MFTVYNMVVEKASRLRHAIVAAHRLFNNSDEAIALCVA